FDKPTRFELIARDGIVFFNDPDGNTAGVLDLSGDTKMITKYTPAEDDTATGSDQPAVADQVTKTGQQKRNLDQPTREGLPFQPQQPAPAVSIVVMPGNNGVVGVEFELTARVQSTGHAAARWSFGDGAESTGDTVRHRWGQPGVFTVRATVSLANGKQLRAETSITVDHPQAPPRIAELTARPAKPVIGQSVHFSAEATGSPQAWLWTVSTPGRLSPEVTARTAEFDHSFTTAGTYTVTLTTTSANGRTAESSRQLTVSRGAVRMWGFRDDHTDLRTPPEEASSGVVAVAGGDNFALALKSSGKVIAWGNPENDQLEVPADALSGVVAISAGWRHGLALKSDGSVRSWGLADSNLQVVPPDALSGVTAIAGGTAHSLALKGGRVIAWGSNEQQQTDVPAAALSGVKAIAAGGTHNLALKEDGTVVGWGYSAWTNLDIPNEARTGVLAIAAGDDRSVVVKEDGTVVAWGQSWEGELSAPPAVPGVVSLDLGFQHALVLRADGSVVGWGSNMNGESIPPDFAQSVLAIAAGAAYSLIVTDGG
ncbi:MAG: regulator of chromosome condensation, partial [Pseudonocardiales bacterium]|nr:regulator of chromosome condensation [Pseudonocardiales bacterium]